MRSFSLVDLQSAAFAAYSEENINSNKFKGRGINVGTGGTYVNAANPRKVSVPVMIRGSSGEGILYSIVGDPASKMSAYSDYIPRANAPPFPPPSKTLIAPKPKRQTKTKPSRARTRKSVRVQMANGSTHMRMQNVVALPANQSVERSAATAVAKLETAATRGGGGKAALIGLGLVAGAGGIGYLVNRNNK